MLAEAGYGFFDFTIGGIASQGDTFLIMHLPGDAAPTTYYKYGRTPANPTDHWYEFLYDGKVGAEINGHVITLHFGDASQGDDVLIPDSQIVDLGAPGFTSTDDDGDPPEKSGGGGGCFIQGLAGTTP